MKRRSMGISLAGLLAASVASGACLAAASSPALDDLTSYSLVRLDGGNAIPVTLDEAANTLKDYDVIVRGDFHDHPANHLAEMALFRALYGKAPRLALTLEMFERDVQPALDDYLAGKIGEEVLKSRGRAWGNYSEAYRPLVEYAKARKLPVIAANAPASVVRCVGMEGPGFLATMPADKRNWAAAELHLHEGAYKDKFMRFLEEDGSHGPEDPTKTESEKKAQAERGFASQVTRDDTMAESIHLYLQKNPGAKVVHVTGNFHAESHLGTVERLKLRAPNLRIAVVTPIAAADPERPAVEAKDSSSGNFAVLLRATPARYASKAEEDTAIEKMRAMFRGRPIARPCVLPAN